MMRSKAKKKREIEVRCGPELRSGTCGAGILG
jgi:hypothetical protein